MQTKMVNFDHIVDTISVDTEGWKIRFLLDKIEIDPVFTRQRSAVRVCHRPLKIPCRQIEFIIRYLSFYMKIILNTCNFIHHQERFTNVNPATELRKPRCLGREWRMCPKGKNPNRLISGFFIYLSWYVNWKISQCYYSYCRWRFIL